MNVCDQSIIIEGDHMKIGYACICDFDESTKIKTCIMKNASEERLMNLIAHNITALGNILKYNETHDIKLFRMSSDIIPFGSSPVNTLCWKQIFASELQQLGSYIKEHHMRVSFHPGQYTILNSLREEVVERAILDLSYHASVLDVMGLDATHKMILHVGGIYDDKALALQRFCDVYKTLSDDIKRRLVIENDDRYYYFEDVMQLSGKLAIPIVFDNLHHHILHRDHPLDDKDCLAYARASWQVQDGTQKMHYSEQDPNRRQGAHAQHVDVEAFVAFVQDIDRQDLDIMLEVKDKNISANACIAQLKKMKIRK